MLVETSPPSLAPAAEAALRDVAASLGLRLLVVFGSPAAQVERRVLELGLHPRPDVVDLGRCSALLALMVARTARVVREAARRRPPVSGGRRDAVAH